MSAGVLSRLASGLGGAFSGLRAAAFGSFGDTVGYSPDRSNIMFYLPADSRMYLDAWTRSEINRKVEWLFQNFGVCKEGVRGIARHTIGTGLTLEINSEDEDFNEAAENDFLDYALSAKRFDRAGRRNFFEAQTAAVQQRMKVGEFLGAHCSNPRWDNEPAVQMFDAQEIATPGDVPDGVKVFDGVAVDADNNALFYYPSGGRKPIPADQFIHWYQPDGIHQVRGLSEFAQAVNPLVDIHDLKKLTTKSAKLHAALAVMVKRAAKAGGPGVLDKVRSAVGGGSSGSGAVAPAPLSGNDDANLERVYGGGAITYVGENGDMKLLTSSHPSPLVEPFITDLLMRDVCAGWGVPAEFFWCIAKLGGANTRFVLEKADLFFQVLAAAIESHFCNPVAVRYLLHRIQTGKLTACKDPNWLRKISWQGPMSLTLDEGKTGALEINQLANGIETMQSINDKRRRKWRQQVRQWFREWKFAREVAKEECGDFADFALSKWRAGVPGASGAEPSGNSKPEEEEEPEEQPDNPKKDDQK